MKREFKKNACLLAASLAAAVIVALCLVGCSSSTPKDVEDLMKNYAENSYLWPNANVDASLELDNGTGTITEYHVNPGSPSGKTLNSKPSYAFRYTLEGENYLIADGTKYYYSIKHESDGAWIVEFSVPFYGIERWMTY